MPEQPTALISQISNFFLICPTQESSQVSQECQDRVLALATVERRTVTNRKCNFSFFLSTYCFIALHCVLCTFSSSLLRKYLNETDFSAPWKEHLNEVQISSNLQKKINLCKVLITNNKLNF
uniref:Uncharacterized protein n=1 Tax=Cacopsylla melanoneura TaxID=428564 RepID=A0A8D8Y8P8_9HEMI